MYLPNIKLWNFRKFGTLGDIEPEGKLVRIYDQGRCKRCLAEIKKLVTAAAQGHRKEIYFYRRDLLPQASISPLNQPAHTCRMESQPVSHMVGSSSPFPSECYM